MELAEFLADTAHDVELRDMQDPAAAAAAKGYGVRRLPAIVIDGQLADPRAGCGPIEGTLTRAGQ